MTPSEHALRLEIRSPWHPGSGRGRGSQYDAVALRSQSGLPYLPGRTLRGLLRDAFECIEHWQHLAPGTTTSLFGELARAGRGQPSKRGRIRIDNAVIGAAESLWLQCTPGAIAALYLAHHQTTIDFGRGVARPKHLRAVELVLPMTLHSRIEIESATAADWDALRVALRLVRAVGAGRTRGFGRAVLRLAGDSGGVQ